MALYIFQVVQVAKYNLIFKAKNIYKSTKRIPSALQQLSLFLFSGSFCTMFLNIYNKWSQIYEEYLQMMATETVDNIIYPLV